jgi:hypothetical protein
MKPVSRLNKLLNSENFGISRDDAGLLIDSLHRGHALHHTIWLARIYIAILRACMSAAEDEGVTVPWPWQQALSEATWLEVVRRWIWFGPTSPVEAASNGDVEALLVVAAASLLDSSAESSVVHGHVAVLKFLMHGAMGAPALRDSFAHRAGQTEELDHDWARQTDDFAALVRRKLQGSIPVAPEDQLSTDLDLSESITISKTSRNSSASPCIGHGKRNRRLLKDERIDLGSGSGHCDVDEGQPSSATPDSCLKRKRSSRATSSTPVKASSPKQPRGAVGCSPKSARKPPAGLRMPASDSDLSLTAAAAAAREAAFVEECKGFLEQRRTYMEARKLGGRRLDPLGEDGDGYRYACLTNLLD